MNRREELIELINTLKQDIATRKSAEFEEDFIADMMKAALEKAEAEHEDCLSANLDRLGVLVYTNGNSA